MNPSSVAVALAMPGDDRETELLSIVGAAGGYDIARRCLDIPDLLASARAGRIDVALIGGEVLRWDADTIARLHAHGVRVVAVADARAGFAALGADVVIDPSPSTDARIRADLVVQALADAREGRGASAATSDPAARGFAHARRQVVEPAVEHAPSEERGPVGRMVAVWGPAGAPGRSTVALCLAQTWAESGARVLLIDADPYGGSLDQMVGLMDDEIPAIAAACRLANHGRLDPASLNELAREVRPRLSLLTGLVRPDRWPELRPASMATLWSVATELADVVVVDTGFCLEEDEELSYDTLAPRRNAATVSALTCSDDVVAVGGVDAIGLRRLVRGLDELEVVLGDHPLHVVGNRGTGKGRQTAVRREVESILRTTGHDHSVAVLPDDPVTCRRAVREGSSPIEVAPRSAYAKAVQALADQVVPRQSRAVEASAAGLPLGRLRRLVG